MYSKLTQVHDLGKVSVLLGVFKGDQVHAALTAKVPGIEPVPVLQIIKANK